MTPKDRMLEVDASERARRFRPRRRQGRCYELAWKYLMWDDRFADWSLVHGEIISPIGDDKPMGHAWLALGDLVYDPVHAMQFNALAYTAKYAAVAIARYTRRDALGLGEETGHFGPW